MLQHLLFEVVGAALLAVALAMFWAARPVDGKASPMFRGKERYEVGYALLILFALTGGLGSMLLGFTT